MANSPYSDIKTVAAPILKKPFIFGDVVAVPIHKSIVRRLGITEDTVFSEEVVEDGILLRIIQKKTDASF